MFVFLDEYVINHFSHGEQLQGIRVLGKYIAITSIYPFAPPGFTPLKFGNSFG